MTSRVLRSEVAFVEHVADLVEQRFRSPHGVSLMAKEVGAGRHIADLVLLSEPERPASLPGTLTVAESVILASLRRGGATRIDLLEARCGVRHRELRSGALDRLLRWGLLERQAGGRIALLEAWNSSGKIVAIEAKLRRWRDALTQATRYRRYADLAFVLLPEDTAGPALSAREEFEVVGVGLLIGHTDRISTAVEARPSDEHDWRREFVYSRLLSREATSSAS